MDGERVGNFDGELVGDRDGKQVGGTDGASEGSSDGGGVAFPEVKNDKLSLKFRFPSL